MSQRTFDQARTKMLIDDLNKKNTRVSQIMEHITQGANPCVVYNSGNSIHHFIIHELIKYDNFDYCFECMDKLKLGIDINSQNKYGYTPLACLISAKHTTDILRFSLKMVDKLDADPHVKSKKGIPYIIYIINGNFCYEYILIQELIKQKKLNPFMNTNIEQTDLSTLDINKLITKNKNSTVYECTWNNVKTALKKTNVEEENFNRKLRRFINEVTIMEKLSKDKVPHTIQFIGYEIEIKTELTFNILMELAICTLADLFHNEKIPLTWDIRLRMMSEITIVIEILHTIYKIVHADIKPQNIFIGENLSIKMGDYNLSFLEGTKKGGRGTNGYHAPEVDNGCTYETDIFSLAIVFCDLSQFNLVTSYFFPNNLSEEEKIEYYKSDKRPPIHYDCPEGVKNIIKLGMLKDPNQRPKISTIKEVIENERNHFTKNGKI